MYIETSSPRKSNESARMSSMTFRPSSRNDSCYMRFWYHMFGKDVDTLSIKLRISLIGPLIPLWNRTGVVSFSSSADANRDIVLCLFGLFLSIYCFQRDNVTLFLKTLYTTAGSRAPLLLFCFFCFFDGSSLTLFSSEFTMLFMTCRDDLSVRGFCSLSTKVNKVTCGGELRSIWQVTLTSKWS